MGSGIVPGYSGESYQPSGVVTRDQIAVFVARALCGGDAQVPKRPEHRVFSDVPTDCWAFKYIECIKRAAIVQGYRMAAMGPAGG